MIHSKIKIFIQMLTLINDDTYLNNYQTMNNVPDITMGELKKAIKACKSNTASGIDNIHNQMIKNLPDNFLSQILILFNKSIQESKVCQIWKTSKITMINKKDSEKNDPSNYFDRRACHEHQRIICKYCKCSSNLFIMRNQ